MRSRKIHPESEYFIRLDHEDDLVNVKELFHKSWKMKDPELFMSIISSDKRRDQNPQEEDTRKEKFCEKLVEAATQTNAWIITEGVTEGIGGIVGDQIKKVFDEKEKRPMAVLSICNWGCIKDKHRLIKNDEQNNCLTVLLRCVRGCNRNEHCFMKNDVQRIDLAMHSVCDEFGGRCEEVSLDQNHTKFVFVDDGRQFHPGCEKIFREKLELKLREYETGENDEYSSTGDSIPLIYFLVGGDDNDIGSVERALENQIPVIVAKGTGGAADRIAQIVQSEEAEGVMDREITEDRKNCLIEKWREKLLVLFDTSAMKDGSQDLSLCILKLLKVSKNSPTHIFVLAADWGNKVFFEELLPETSEEHHLEYAMCKLLMKEKCSYVKILLDKGVKLAEVVKRLEESELTGVLRNKIAAHLLEQAKTENIELCAAKFLCIWSAYRGKTEMAKDFWREGKDYLAMASMAYKVSKDKKRKLAGKEERHAMKEQMTEFKTIATGFLSTCDKDSRQKTIALLRGRVPDLKQQTPMRIALDSDFKEFVAQSSFQGLLDQIWTKQIIDHNKMMYIPLIVAIFCPLAAPFLFKYREDEKPRENLDDLSPKKQSFIYFFLRIGSFLDAPVIKFAYNTLSYLAYLVLFSIVMLTDFRANMSPSEIALTIWTFTLIIEEFRQIIMSISDSTAYRFPEEYLNVWNLPGEYLNIWNVFDVSALTLYVVGFILRLIYHIIPSICLECLYVARIVLCFSLLLSVLRVLQLLSINATLGPKIYMIGRLLKDMISFLLILTIFISAYGIVSNAILYPNQQLNAKLLKDVFYDAWWTVIGQFNSEDAIGTNCKDTDPKSPNVSIEYCSSRTDPHVDYVACKESRCPANTWLVSVLQAFYALFTVILMLNVLIAMFNVTFTKVETKQKRVSKMQRYRLILEYYFRSMLPAPLCVFAYLKHVPWLCTRCKCCCCTVVDDQENIFSKPMGSLMKTWEESMLKKYEEEVIIQKQREIAVIKPESGDDDRWGVYTLVLKDLRSSVNISMQDSFSQMEQRPMQHIDKTNRRDEEEEDKDENGDLTDTDLEVDDSQSLITPSSSNSPPTPSTPGKIRSPPSPATTGTTSTPDKPPENSVSDVAPKPKKDKPPENSASDVAPKPKKDKPPETSASDVAPKPKKDKPPKNSASDVAPKPKKDKRPENSATDVAPKPEEFKCSKPEHWPTVTHR